MKYKIVNTQTGEELHTNLLLMEAHNLIKTQENRPDLRIVPTDYNKIKTGDKWIWGE